MRVATDVKNIRTNFNNTVESEKPMANIISLHASPLPTCLTFLTEFVIGYTTCPIQAICQDNQKIARRARTPCATSLFCYNSTSIFLSTVSTTLTELFAGASDRHTTGLSIATKGLDEARCIMKFFDAQAV